MRCTQRSRAPCNRRAASRMSSTTLMSSIVRGIFTSSAARIQAGEEDGPHRGGSDEGQRRPEGASENTLTPNGHSCPPFGGQIGKNVGRLPHRMRGSSGLGTPIRRLGTMVMIRPPCACTFTLGEDVRLVHEVFGSRVRPRSGNDPVGIAGFGKRWDAQHGSDPAPRLSRNRGITGAATRCARPAGRTVPARPRCARPACRRPRRLRRSAPTVRG